MAVVNKETVLKKFAQDYSEMIAHGVPFFEAHLGRDTLESRCWFMFAKGFDYGWKMRMDSATREKPKGKPQ